MYPIKSERGDLFDVNMIIVMMVRLKGPLSFEKISSAFSAAVSNNEVLNMRVDLSEEGISSYVENDAPESFIRETDENLDEVRKREEKKRFRIEEGEFIRAFARKETEEEWALLFLMHHLGGDGKSLTYFIEDMMKALSGQDLTYKKFVPVDIKEKRIDKISTLLAKYYNRKWSGRVYGWTDLDKAYEVYWKDKETVIDIKEIPKEEMQEIRNRLHEAGAGFTSYLAALYAKDFDRQVDIGYAVDARSDGNRSMSNQATGISVKYRYDRSKDIYTNAKAIQELMDKKLKDPKKRFYVLNFMSLVDPTLVDAVDLVHAGTEDDKTAKNFARLLGFTDNKRDISITNLTVLDIPDRYDSVFISRPASCRIST